MSTPSPFCPMSHVKHLQASNKWPALCLSRLEPSSALGPRLQSPGGRPATPGCCAGRSSGGFSGERQRSSEKQCGSRQKWKQCATRFFCMWFGSVHASPTSKTLKDQASASLQLWHWRPGRSNAPNSEAPSPGEESHELGAFSLVTKTKYHCITKSKMPLCKTTLLLSPKLKNHGTQCDFPKGQQRLLRNWVLC